MIDFNLDIEAEAQRYHYIFFLGVYLFAFIMNKSLLKERYIERKRNNTALFLYIPLVVLTLVAVTEGDFYHYATLIQSGQTEGHMEPIYYWFSNTVNYNYLLWRIVVWGSALLLISCIFKRLQIDLYYSFFTLFICYIIIFSYARASLACSVYFLGLTYVIKPTKSKILSYLIGLTLIWCSHFFHSSVYFLIALTPLILIPLNKHTIWIIVLIILMISGSMYQYFVSNIFQFTGSKDYADRFLWYSDQEMAIIHGGVSGLLTAIFKYGTFFLPAIILTKNIILCKEIIDPTIQYLQRITMYIVLGAIIFGVLTGAAYFFYRLLYMSMIPITALIILSFKNQVISLQDFKACVYWGIINILYFHLYGLYVC